MRPTLNRLFLIVAGGFLSAASLLNAQSSGTEDAILQGFYWNTNPGDFSSNEGVWWDTIAHVAPDLAEGGIVTLWTPPANKGFAGTFDMGYGVYDYYDFGSFFQKGTLRTRHGNATQFFNTIDVLHQNGLKVMGDLVLNHRAGAESTQPEECDHQGDGILDDRFTRFRPASGRAPMNAEDFHPTDTHCDLFGPYHDRVFFEDLCYFEDIDQVLDPSVPNNGWYHGPHNLGRAGDSLIVWGRYLLDEVGFDELRLDAVKHIEPGFMAPFLVEMAAGDQPFAVGELFDGDIGTLKGYRDQVEAFNTTFGTGSKDANLAIFDFNLRFAIRDFCNNTSGGYDMWNLNNAGLLFNGMPGEDIVTFVENHDFDRIGYVTTSCSDPDVVAQVGSTCLKFSIDSGHDPVVSDKHIGYAYITAAEGRPSVFWKDWFWFGLKDEIKWQLAMRSEMASGSTTPIQFLNPFFVTGNGGDIFVMNRNGNGGQGGLILTLNDSPNTEGVAFVNTPFSNMELKDYSDAYLFTQTTAFGDSRAQVKALPRNYAWYAPTGRYPTPPDAEPSAFTLGSHEGAKLHFLALRASDASNLLVNGAPIEPGDQIAVQRVGGGDAVGLGRVGQSFEWDGVHDMIIEVLGGGNASEAKGGLLNGEGFELVVFDRSTGTTEVVATLEFAANSTGFNFNPLRPTSKGGAFSLSTSHGEATYQVGAISLITGFDTRPISCVASDAADSAYDDGWQTNDSDGSGFGAWALNATSGSAGHFMAGSTGNGDGDTNGDGDIDTGGRSWGLFANSGATSEAIRDFTQPLAVDEAFSIRMDNGFVDGTVGFALQNSDGQNLLEYTFAGGSANYAILDASGSVDSGIDYTDEGLDISIALTGPTTYELTATRLEDGSSNTVSGNLVSPTIGSQEVTRLRLFNFDAGFNAPANLYFNSLEICGEPACPIASVSAGTQTSCDPADNTYDQEITVNFSSTPANGQLSVNGTTVSLNIVGGTQTLTLTDLVSDGQDVDVTVVLTGSEACTLTETALFTAPTDCQVPTISCPANVTVGTDPGLCSAQIVYNAPIGVDNLPGAATSLTNGLGSGADFPVGVTTETYTVTDAAGNTEQCAFNVVVNDVENPVANCKSTTIDIASNGMASLLAAQINNGSTDNCTTPENLTYLIISGQTTYSCFDVGLTYGVTLQVTDDYGNNNICTANVTVADGSNNCVQGEALDFDGDDDYVDFGDVNDFGTSDFTVEFWFNASSIVPANSLGGTYLLAKGLTSAGTPSGAGYGFRLNVENGQNELSFIIGAPSNKVSFNGINTNTWYHVAGVRKGTTLSLYVDGILAQSVNTGSVINVNTNLSLGLGAVIRSPFGPNTTSFEGKIDEVRIWGEAFCQDEVVNYTSCALSGSETGLLAYYDFNQGFAGVNNSPENVLIDRTANGNDGSLINFDLDGNASNWLAPGITQSGNCSPYVDSTNPVIICPATVTVNTDPGLCTANVTYAAATASDNCGDVTIAYSQNSGTIFPLATTSVTATATDESGNSNSCSFNVIVNDNEAPVALCQDVTLQLDATANASITAADVDNGSSDNCGIASLSVNPSTFTCSDVMPGAGGTATTELITNGGFETSDLSGWTSSGPGSSNPPCVGNDWAVYFINPSSLSPCVPTGYPVQEGNYANYLDFNAFSTPNEFILSQQVSIPTGITEADLSWLEAYFVDSDAPPPPPIAPSGNEDSEEERRIDQENRGFGGGLATRFFVIELYDISGTSLLASLHVENFFSTNDSGADGANWLSRQTDVTTELQALEGQDVLFRVRAFASPEDNTPTFTGSPAASTSAGFSLDAVSLLVTTVSGGSTPVTLTVTDVNGNSATCTAEVTVEDNIPPTAICQDVTVQLDAYGNGSITANDIDNGSNDACGIASLSANPTSFDCEIAPTFTASNANDPSSTTLTVTDANGNTSTCTANVTVEDNIPPTANCQNVTVQLDASGNGSITVNDVNNGSSDACGITNLSLDLSTFNCGDIGSNSTTLKVTDTNGNMSVCTATVTVEDNVAPTAVCQDVTVQLDASGNGSLTTGDVDDGSSDACGIASLSVDPSTFTCADVMEEAGGVATTELITNGGFETSDLSGWSSSGPGSSNPPCFGNDWAVYFINPSPLSPCVPTGYPVQDGSYAAYLDFNALSSPNEFILSQQISIPLGITAADLSWLEAYSIIDSNGPVLAAGLVDEDSEEETRMSRRSLGESLDTWSFTIEIYNLSGTTLLASLHYEDFFISDDSGSGGANWLSRQMDVTTQLQALEGQDVLFRVKAVVVPGEIGPIDPITSVESINAGFSVDAVSLLVTTVSGPSTTLTVTDVNGNVSTCVTAVTVEDNNPPTAVCANPTVNLGDGGTVSVATSLFDGGSSAVCGDVSFSADITEFDCDDLGSTVSVTLTVTAQTNNETAICTSMVTVTDTNSECCAPANAVCNNITVQLNASGIASIIPGDVGGGSTADCGPGSEIVSPMDFTCDDIGDPVSVSYTIVDANGASSSCTAEVTVEDNIPPTPVCKTTTVQLSPDNGMYTLLESNVYDASASNDNCSIDNVSFPATTYDCDDEDQTYTVPVTVTDAGGNMVNCNATITVTLGDALPGNWSANDIGNTGFLGNEYSFDPCIPTNGEFAITGGGMHATSSTTDNVAFAGQTICGDGMITAKIESVTPNGYGGLMIRETTAAGAKQVSVFSNLTNVLRHEHRALTNGPKQVQAFYRPYPFWLRLQRQGVWIFAYYSTTGTSFSYLHAVYAPMQNCVEIGLASYTYLPNAQTEAVFSNVSVSGGDSLIDSGGLASAAQRNQERTEAELYPNPTSDIFTLAFPKGLLGEATATLRNQIGQVVKQRQLKSGDLTTEWNISDLPAGLYFMEVRQEGLPPQVLRMVKAQ